MIKKITLSIMIMIVATLLLLVTSINIFSNTILNEKYIKNILKKNNYYELTYNVIKEDFANYAPQLRIGENETPLDDIVNKKSVEIAINDAIESIYHNKKITVDTSKVEENLDTKIDNTLREYNRIPNTEEQKALKEFKKGIVTAYKNQILYSEKHISKLPNIYQKINNIIPSIKGILIFLIVIFLIAMIIIQNDKKQSIKNIGIILLTTGILSIIIKYLCTNRISHILFLNENISRVFIYIIKDILSKIATLGIILGIVGIIGIIIGIGRTIPTENN